MAQTLLHFMELKPNFTYTMSLCHVRSMYRAGSLRAVGEEMNYKQSSIIKNYSLPTTTTATTTNNNAIWGRHRDICYHCSFRHYATSWKAAGSMN
jgi:hypothetical protein